MNNKNVEFYAHKTVYLKMFSPISALFKVVMGPYISTFPFTSLRCCKNIFTSVEPNNKKQNTALKLNDRKRRNILKLSQIPTANILGFY